MVEELRNRSAPVRCPDDQRERRERVECPSRRCGHRLQDEDALRARRLDPVDIESLTGLVGEAFAVSAQVIGDGRFQNDQ